MSGSAHQQFQAVDFEKQQAAEADAKEAARQQRLTQGQTLIDQIFNGSPVMGTKTQQFRLVDVLAAKQDCAPTRAPSPLSGPACRRATRRCRSPRGGALGAGAAYAAHSCDRRAAAQASAQRADQANSTGGSGRRWRRSGGLPGRSRTPDGKIYNQGDPLSYDTQYDTGQTTGGFDDAFYDAYKQKVLDYYQPDEQRQYDAAQRDLTYSLARAGTLQSSTAADKQGELAYNDALQKANIVANANTQEGNLKSQIQSNKQALINQLYSTEDPTLTANLAQSSANATQAAGSDADAGGGFVHASLDHGRQRRAGPAYPNSAGLARSPTQQARRRRRLSIVRQTYGGRG